MLCAHGFQCDPSPSVGLYWPALGLWPEVRPRRGNLRQLCRGLELMGKLQEEIRKETQPLCCQREKDGEPFGLILDTRGFSPEELTIKQVGRKLRVSGRTEEKQEDEGGCYFHSLREFRREFELPEGVKAEDVTCRLSPEGRLHIQAAAAPSVKEAERELTIRRSLPEEEQQSVRPNIEDGGPGTDDSVQDQPANMD